MKGHRSRGKAKHFVAAGYGRCVRPFVKGQHKRLEASLRDLLPPVARNAPSIVRSAKEKQIARAVRAKRKETPWRWLGRAVRKLMGIPE